MSGSIDYNVNPYYDDYDEDKGYHRLLFRPGRGVQARELTQLQTVLQNQIRRFGQNIFKDGSIVIPGGVSVDKNYEYVKLNGSPDLSTIEVSETLTGATSGNSAVLLQKVDISGSDPATFYIQYTGGGRFIDGETLNASGGGSFTTASSASTGQGTKVNLDKGVFFVKGFFVAAVTQSLLIEKYGVPTGTTEVGLVVSESIVQNDTDTSLLSNAAGFNNENAPGADRLKITATLTEKSSIEDSNGETSQDYISLAMIVDGDIKEKFLKTQYNILADEMAKRTFEESGNYTVDPFIINVENHPTDNSKLRLELDPGIAYVKGYRVEKALLTELDIDKALTTSTVPNQNTGTSIGNYIRTSAPTYLPDISVFQQVNLVNSSSTVIGTARIRYVEKESGVSIYRFFLFDVNLTGSNKFNQVRTVSASVTGGTFSATIVDDNNSALSTDAAELKATNNNNLLFPIPQNRVKDLSDITITVQRYTSSTSNSSGVITLDTGDSTITWADTANWILVRNDTGAIYTTATFGAVGNQTIQISNLTLSTTFTIIAFVTKTALTTNVRTKTLTTKTDQALSIVGGGDNTVLLGEADIYKVTSIKDAADNSDITDRYIVDNGQRDNYYGQGKLILKTGETPPVGSGGNDVLVTFSFFAHGSGSYFNVDSYDSFVASNSYGEIPTHTLSSGSVIRLHDYWDFRPRFDDNFADFSTAGAIVNEIPKNNDVLQADIEFYLPRQDYLYIDSENNFGIQKGVPSLSPKLSDYPANAMPLYTIFLNGGVYDKDDISTTFIENKRFTMRDIGKIETRINRLEEWSTLSLLEVDASTLEVLDNSGNTRFKSGFFVDNFKSHNFANTGDNEYRAAINVQRGLLRPRSYENNSKLIYVATDSDSNTSSNVTVTGDILTLSYTEVVEFTQPYATEAVNVNPYAVATYSGSIELSPSTDEWRDVVNTTRTVTNIVENNPVDPEPANNDENWTWNWWGVPNTNLGLTPGRNETGFGAMAFQFGPEPEPFRVQNRQFLNNENQGQGTVTESSDTRTVSVRLIPFIRSRLVYFRVQGLLPNTTHKAYFDGVDVSAWCREETFQQFASNNVQESVSEFSNASAHPSGSTALTSDTNGVIEGSFFIPNTSSLRFRTGRRTFHLWDDKATSASNAISKAYGSYTARGTLETNETVVTRRVVRPAQTFNATGPSIRWADPVAQSFIIDNDEGAFITSVDIPFQSASSTLPIRCQIRPMTNGLPTNEILGEKYLNASAFTGKTSNAPVFSNTNTFVTFTFNEPIRVNGGEEYAIVLVSDSVDYNVWTAVAGDFLNGSSTRRLMQQPTLGSFFKSQNGSTWTPDQSRDMMFRLKRARFSTNQGTAYFENVNIQKALLPNNPIVTTNASTTININCPNHGLIVGDKMTIAGAATTNGISAANINGQRTVSAVHDKNWVSVTAGASATSAGSGGGNAVTAFHNYTFDEYYTSVNVQSFQSTTLAFGDKTTSGRSIAGSETAYVRDSSFNNFFPNDLVRKETIRMIASDENETANLSGNNSYTMRASLLTTNDYVSPVIDLQRLSITTIGKSIDNPAASVASGFNVPLNFVAETDNLNGSAEAKHITIPVTLESEAVAIRVIMAVNRPADATVELYHKLIDSGDDASFADKPWVLATIDEAIQSDENRAAFRDYQYTIEGNPFTRYMLKIVMKSKNQAKSPTIKDLRVIALAT